MRASACNNPNEIFRERQSSKLRVSRFPRRIPFNSITYTCKWKASRPIRACLRPGKDSARRKRMDMSRAKKERRAPRNDKPRRRGESRAINDTCKWKQTGLRSSRARPRERKAEGSERVYIYTLLYNLQRATLLCVYMYSGGDVEMRKGSDRSEEPTLDVGREKYAAAMRKIPAYNIPRLCRNDFVLSIIPMYCTQRICG